MRKVQPVIYNTELKTDKEKLASVFSLIEQLRLEHNRQGALARSDWGKYQDKWYVYALRPRRLGGNLFTQELLPLLQESNRLKGIIRKANYTDSEWKALAFEERVSANQTLFGDKAALKELPTRATSPYLDNSKTIELGKVTPFSVPDPFQDFTGYTEVDEDTDITVTSTKIDVVTMRRDALSYVRSPDFGAGHFGDFEHLITFYQTSGDRYSIASFWAVSNGSNTIQQMDTNNEGMDARIYNVAGANVPEMYILDSTNDNADSYTGTNATIYYCTFERSGTTLTNKIYDDSGRTNLLDTPTITCGATTYRYVYGLQSRESGTESITIYSENLDIQEFVAPTPVADGDLIGIAIIRKS